MDNDTQSDSGEKTETPPVFIIAVPPEQPSQPISWWVKKFFACNPFYLISAAMLLYGVYLVSFDANFLGREISQLAFNFGSLQVYEILLVGTAVFLARRRIWYDSVLLVALENLLVLVPFILISQAALLSQAAPLSRGIVLGICGTGAAAVLLRFWGLKHFFRDLNLPRRALVCGLVLLLVNVVLPLVYRHLHDSKIGTKPVEGAAYALNRYSWLLLVPAMLALINCLPWSRRQGELLPQHRRLPVALFALWFAGSTIHVYCLSYVYNFDWEFVFILPLLWVAAWTAFLRCGEFTPVAWLPKVLLGPPVLIALLGLTQEDHTVFRALTILNLVGYLALFLKDRRNLAALHLMLLSGATLLAGLVKPVEFATPSGTETVGSIKWLVICGLLYAVGWMMRSRNPKTGVWGALLIALATLGLAFDSVLGIELSVQSGMLFLLLHSLRWVDSEHKGANAARILACVFLCAHALLIVHFQLRWAKEIVFSGGGLLFVAAMVSRLFTGSWRPMVVPIAAILVALIPPVDFAAGKLQATSAGLLAVAGSFLLFGLGTLAAVTKPRWNAPAATVPSPAETNSPV